MHHPLTTMSTTTQTVSLYERSETKYPLLQSGALSVYRDVADSGALLLFSVLFYFTLIFYLLCKQIGV